MSISAMTPLVAPIGDVTAANFGNPGHDAVVEVSLLLPSEWASDLIDLARKRHQSVGQVIRAMIGDALHEGASAT